MSVRVFDKGLRAVQPLQAPPRSGQGNQRPRFREAHAHSGRCHPAGARRARRARLRDDRQRQDRRFRSADPPQTHGDSRAAPRARSSSRPRASWRRRFSRSIERPGHPHARSRRRRLRRSGNGTAGTRVPQRGRHHRRHAGAAARSLSVAVREARRASRFSCSTRPTACSTWAFCPTSAACSAICRPRRQTLFFSATMPPPIAALTREMLHDPVTHQHRARSRRRRSASRRPCTRCRSDVEVAAAPRAAPARRRCRTRSCSRARSTARTASREYLVRATSSAQRIHGNRSQAQRTAALAGFKAGAIACWSPPTSPRAASTSRRSATSSISTCPAVPEDYIHRVGRTARAELTGMRSRFVAPEEEGRSAGHRARDRQAPSARDDAGFRLRVAACRGSSRYPMLSASRRFAHARPRIAHGHARMPSGGRRPSGGPGRPVRAPGQGVRPQVRAGGPAAPKALGSPQVTRK